MAENPAKRRRLTSCVGYESNTLGHTLEGYGDILQIPPVTQQQTQGPDNFLDPEGLPDLDPGEAPHTCYNPEVFNDLQPSAFASETSYPGAQPINIAGQLDGLTPDGSGCNSSLQHHNSGLEFSPGLLCATERGDSSSSTTSQPLHPIASHDIQMLGGILDLDAHDTGSIGNSQVDDIETALDKCCYGEVHMDATSSFKNSDGNTNVPVSLWFSGDLVKLYIDGSKDYVGLFKSSGLSTLVQGFSVTLDSVLILPKARKENSKRRSFVHQPIAVQVRIVIYGCREDLDAVGTHLDSHGVYLQIPTEYDHTIEYINPQYLLRPGASMPRVMSGSSRVLSKSKCEMSSDVLDDEPKGQLQQIFNSADGPTMFREVEPSKRLCTALKEHQKKALSMMIEREYGVLENAQFATKTE
ncbi:hypothetical protein Hte_009721 [Hypoxylon texense]